MTQGGRALADHWRAGRMFDLVIPLAASSFSFLSTRSISSGGASKFRFSESIAKSRFTSPRKSNSRQIDAS